MSENQTQEIVVLQNVRVSYLYAFRPYVGKNDSGQETKTYCCHALMAPDHPGIAMIKAAQRKVAAAAWGAQAEAVLQQLAAQDKLCLHNGDVSKMGNPDYAGKFYVSANGKTRPNIVVTRGGVNVAIEADDPYAPYSGCWSNVIVAVYAQGPNNKPSKYGKRLNAQFMGIQFVRHDEQFGGGGRVAKPDEFPVVAGVEADGAAPVAASAGAAGGLI